MTLSGDGVRWSVGNWFDPERVEIAFDDVRSIRTRQKEVWGRRGSRRIYRHAIIKYRSGRSERIQVDNTMLVDAWPAIAARAIGRGVVVEGDEFTY